MSDRYNSDLGDRLINTKEIAANPAFSPGR
jgi:hypothetical protein